MVLLGGYGLWEEEPSGRSLGYWDYGEILIGLVVALAFTHQLLFIV